MHPQHDGANAGVRFIAGKRTLDPGKLRFIELITGSVIQRDEIYSALNPVVIRAERVIMGIVAKALRAQRWRIEPVGKLLQEVGPRLGGNEFVVADGQIHGGISEGVELLRDEIRPRNPLVVGYGEMFAAIFRGSQQVLIEVIVGAEISQVPIKLSAIGPNAHSDARHNDVAAVAGISRNCERPCITRLRREASLNREQAAKE